MIDWINRNYVPLQGVPLFVMALAMMIFGASVLAQQSRDGRPVVGWPMSGPSVGGWFLLIKGALPMTMSLSRFHLLPFKVTEWETTLIYLAIAVDAVVTVTVWWRRGFIDQT
jgi:hypothetical protein